MKKSKFTEQQIAFALRQAETGTKVKEIAHPTPADVRGRIAEIEKENKKK
jgi:hypothetical protein